MERDVPNTMKVNKIPPELIIKNWSENKYPLVHNYIGCRRPIEYGDIFLQHPYEWYGYWILANEPRGIEIPFYKAIGFACLREESTGLHIAVLEIEHKFKGNGSLILNHIINTAEKKNSDWIAVEPLDDSVIHFYSKFRFGLRADGIMIRYPEDSMYERLLKYNL